MVNNRIHSSFMCPMLAARLHASLHASWPGTSYTCHNQETQSMLGQATPLQHLPDAAAASKLPCTLRRQLALCSS